MGGIVSDGSNYVYLFISPKSFYGHRDHSQNYYTHGLNKLISMGPPYKLVGPKELTVWRS